MNDSFVQDLIIENKNLKETILLLTQSNALLAQSNSTLVLEKEKNIELIAKFNQLHSSFELLLNNTFEIKDIVGFIKSLYTSPKSKSKTVKKKLSNAEKISELQAKLIKPKKLY